MSDQPRVLRTKLPAGVQAGGRTRTPQVRDASGMNRTEARFYREYLRPRELADEIGFIRFQPGRLKLADRVTYTPDYEAQEWSVTEDRFILQFYDVKGSKNGKPRIEPVSRVKMEWAAQRYPECHFYVAWLSQSGAWCVKRMGEP